MDKILLYIQIFIYFLMFIDILGSYVNYKKILGKTYFQKIHEKLAISEAKLGNRFIFLNEFSYIYTGTYTHPFLYEI